MRILLFVIVLCLLAAGGAWIHAGGAPGPVIEYMHAPEFAAAGYNVVIQDVRGTGHSQGICDPAGHQDEDGYDTVEAILKLGF